MNFTLPEARRERMEQLLEYLGSRANDFKKCFDIESEWCWKYADLMLRGLEKRELEYAEGHHIVPASFYGKRRCNISDDGNLTTLTYGEHVWAHYCLALCATGKMRGKMAKAFLIMYSIGNCKRRRLMPSEFELLDAIPDMELQRIRGMEPRWAKLEAEGRTHKSDDLVQYRKEYYAANKEKLAEKNKAYREANKEKLAERRKVLREANKEKVAERKKAWCEANKEKLAEQRKARYRVNREKIIERGKAYYEANRDKRREYGKAWREANKVKIAEQKKERYEANREEILEYNKAYREANKEKLVEYHKDYYEANKENILDKRKAYRDVNKEKISVNNKAYREANRQKLSEYDKTYYIVNREKITERKKAYREAKKAAGYRYRKDPVTGKRGLVFVGLPEQEVAA